MNKKQHRRAIDDNLSKALEPPPKRTPPPALNEILSQYAPPPSVEPKVEPELPTPLTAPTPRTARTPVTSAAPTRDFQKVANSIVRQAVPAGLFTGKSKQLYDFLYARTRGAVVPLRAVRITKESLMQGAGIGSERTLYKNLRRLVTVGLIQVRSLGGEHAGSEYTVLLPEEVTLPTPPTPPTDATHTSQKVGTPPTAQSGVGGVGLTVDMTEGSPAPKTFSFKTNTDDDERIALSDLHSILATAAQKLTGRAPKATEREQWAELARVLVAELNEAAARAGSVSSVPAFLSEHLRRKFAQRATERKRAGKRAAPVEGVSEVPATGPTQELRLTPEEIDEQARLIAELLESGYTIEQAEAQFSGGLHADDWTVIRKTATMNIKQKGKA